jgi:signal transduction histidine kinase
VLAVVLVAAAAAVDETPATDRAEFRERVFQRAVDFGVPLDVAEREQLREDALAQLEREVNRRTLDRLRNVALASLLALLVLSLVIGYVVAGRVLQPVSRITGRARALAARAPDLSGRIALVGPDDELKELADTLDDFLDRTETAVESQRRFLADASHELRTPLAVAQTNLDLALDGETDLAEHRRAAGIAREQLRRMGRLIGNLLALERGSGRRRQRLEVDALLRSVAEDVRATAERAGIRLELPERSGLAVMGDPDDLRRAVGNLAENAIVHNHTGRRVELRTGARDGWVTIAVSDDGPGIAPADQARIFERFHRVGRGGAGTGLGLAIVRELVRESGGEVTLESALGRGATFTLLLPRAGGPGAAGAA